MSSFLKPEILLEAYRRGFFPMAAGSDHSDFEWIRPESRGLLSIEDLHIPRRLRKTLKKNSYDIKIDSDFPFVVSCCAEKNSSRCETWINKSLIKIYCALFEMGYAHSVEVWQEEYLAGGLFGVAIGGAFFGESMFSKRKDASKIALIHLVARLWKGKFRLLDTQFINDHLKQFGAHEVPHEIYIEKLSTALSAKADFKLEGQTGASVLQDYLSMKTQRDLIRELPFPV